ncbi:MAG: hypothetical protein V7785_16550 [Bermanella sp.]
MNRLNYSAISLGLITVLVLSMTIGWFSGAMGFKSSQLTILTLTWFVTALGGFIAAYYSKSFKFYNAIATAVIGVVLFTLPFIGKYPTWLMSLDIFMSFPFAYLGAHVESKYNK